MARKLNSLEAQQFSEAIATEQPELLSEADPVMRALMEKRDEALELSRESSVWFGDILPGAFGFKS
jgi:hypothetical protein